MANLNLSYFYFLNSIVIGNSEFIDLSVAGQLPNLKELFTVNTGYDFNNVTEQLTGLRTFVSSDAHVSSQSLRNLNNLYILTIFSQPLEDITFLASMPKLRQLNLSSNGVTSLTGLEHVQNLKRLYSVGNSFGNISALSALENITSLTMQYAGIEDLTPITHLSGMRYLRLNDNNISDINAISSMQHLRTAYLHRNSIGDLTPLTDKKHMTWLNLADNAILDVEPLFTLPNLDILSVYGNPNISDEDMQRLRDLGIRIFEG